MGATKGNKPIFDDKEGTVHLAIFKNKNLKGTVYPVVCIQVYRFPFKYTQRFYLNVSEIPNLRKLLERMPEINKKEKKKK